MPASSAELPRIGKSGPPVGVVMPLPRVQRSLLTRPALDADSRKINSIFDRADRGQTCDLADLYEDCRLLDARLDAVARKRVLAIMGRPLLIKPAPGWETDREAKAHAEEVQRLFLRSPGFRAGIAHLAHATLDLPRVCEQEFTVTAEGRYMPVLHRRFPNRFAFDADLNLGWLDNPGVYTSLKPLSDYPDRFVVHAPSGGRSSYPWRQGALLSRCIPSIAKRAGIRWWLQYLERFGLPLPYVRIPDNEGGDPDSTSSLKGKAKQALRDLQADWSAVFTGEIELDVVPASGQVNAESHARFVEYQDTQDAIVVLGQNLTTEVQGGSYAATEAHRYVADDILGADCMELAGDTITTQIVEPTNRANWPGGPPLVAEIITTRRQPFTPEHYSLGLCSADELREGIGWTALPDGTGKDPRPPMAQVPPSYPSAAGGGAPPPFNQSNATTVSPTRSQTSDRSSHPLANALSRK